MGVLYTLERNSKAQVKEIMMNFVLFIIFFVVLFATDEFVETIRHLSSSYLGWSHAKAPLYMSFLRSKWEKLPVIQATFVPEMFLANFSRNEYLRLSNNMRVPVVVRGAFVDSVAVKKWNDKYLKSAYGLNMIVLREIDSLGTATLTRRPLKELYELSDKHNNLSIVGSSSIFVENKSFKADIGSFIDDKLVGTKGQAAVGMQVSRFRSLFLSLAPSLSSSISLSFSFSFSSSSSSSSSFCFCFSLSPSRSLTHTRTRTQNQSYK